MATLDNFQSETQLTASATNLVTTNGSEKKFIGKVTVTNTSVNNVEVTFWRILTATTATTGSGGNWLVKESIPAGKEVIIRSLMQHVLGNNMAIKGLADTASVINFDASGTTET